MNRKVFVILIIFSNILVFNLLAQDKNFPILKGPYLGQEKPGLTATLFAPELLSTALGLSFTPDGNELYFTSWGGKSGAVIMFMKMVDEKWTTPQIAPFSGKYMDWDLNLSPDGNRLYFSSRRPLEGDGELKDPDIWFVEKNAMSQWGEPKNLEEPVNTDSDEVHPTVSDSSTIYFFSGIKGGMGSADIYLTKFVNGQYSKPENLRAPINTKMAEMDPFIAPDESYLIFHSMKEGGFGANDLYISFRKNDSSWEEPVNMGPRINSNTSDYCGRVSHDGRYFFFTSSRNGPKGVYWINAKIIEDLKPKKLKK